MSATPSAAPLPPPALPDSATFRSALRALVGQVSVISIGLAEEATGLTLTSASSLSTDPPMLIACVNRSASAHGALRVGAALGWQALGADQQAVAERFSGKGGVQGAARFAGAEWRVEHGAQLLVGAALACACQIEDLIDRATHTIVIARITSLHSAPQLGSLAYRDGAYLPLPVSAA